MALLMLVVVLESAEDRRCLCCELDLCKFNVMATKRLTEVWC
jgi:hypothetical protein